MTDDQRQRAIRRIRAKRGFWVHASIYLAVIAFLFLIWAMTSATYPWPLWPMLGWGIGVIAHAASVYIRPAEITEERIQRELQGRSGS
ncbi:MAG: 2TM domain-containing protein [Acidimicrobiia bacterium]|nr:2TM domain-containing protein [Acidimicrobiia bacterium]